MSLGVTLYISNSIEAVEFYCDAFEMEIGYNVKNDDGSFLHVELGKKNGEGFAVSESQDKSARDMMLVTKQPTMSLGINLIDDIELHHAYEKLTQGGHILRPMGSLPWSPLSADVVDKFGVCWYIYVSQHKPD